MASIYQLVVYGSTHKIEIQYHSCQDQDAQRNLLAFYRAFD